MTASNDVVRVVRRFEYASEVGWTRCAPWDVNIRGNGFRLDGVLSRLPLRLVRFSSKLCDNKGARRGTVLEILYMYH